MSRLLCVSLLMLLSVFLSMQEKKEYQTPHYVKRLEFFRQNPAKQEGAVLLMGDSMIEGGRWDEYFPDLDVVNRGIVGDNTEGMSNRFDEIIHAKLSILFLSGGVNDISQNVKTKEIISNFR